MVIIAIKTIKISIPMDKIMSHHITEVDSAMLFHICF